MKQLIQIFEKAQPLILLSRAIVDYQISGNMEDEAKQVWQQVIPYWLKRLLQQIQSGSEELHNEVTPFEIPPLPEETATCQVLNCAYG